MWIRLHTYYVCHSLDVVFLKLVTPKAWVKAIQKVTDLQSLRVKSKPASSHLLQLGISVVGYCDEWLNTVSAAFLKHQLGKN